MNTEMPVPGQTDAVNAWQKLVSDIEDPKNLGVGDVHYWVVQGGKGAVDQFIENGGKSIHARRVGTPSEAQQDATVNADKPRD